MKTYILYTLKSRFNEIPQFSEQLSAPLNYFITVNLIRFNELHDLVDKRWSDGPHSLNQDLDVLYIDV